MITKTKRTDIKVTMARRMEKGDGASWCKSSAHPSYPKTATICNKKKTRNKADNNNLHAKNRHALNNLSSYAIAQPHPSPNTIHLEINFQCQTSFKEHRLNC